MTIARDPARFDGDGDGEADRDADREADVAPWRAVAAAFPRASAELRERRELLRRIDTKFVCPADLARALMVGLAPHYAALAVPSGNLATYDSLYYDTADLRCYHDHRRGRRLRHKVRVRHYPDRDLSYLEVKSKRNEDVTEKHRRALRFGDETLGPAERAFVAAVTPLPVDDLRPALRVGFRRLSLVALGGAERVTIDLGLTAATPDGARWSIDDVVVIEVKQSPFCVRTPVMQALYGAGLRERSMSKYTLASAILRAGIRRNRLLPELRALGSAAHPPRAGRAR